MKPIASLSLDLDDKWSYLQTRGDDTWKKFPSYLDYAVPRILDFFDRKNLKITFFIIGQDAAFERNRPILRKIADAGHEIANHSFGHQPWLHLFSKDDLRDELEKAESAIFDATGAQTRGFRGPGYSLSTSVLEVLSERNYQYDATAFPNVLNPLARRYFFSRSNLSRAERKQRKGIFGTWHTTTKPVSPYHWKLENATLPEIPVTTMPIFRIPIHFTYVIHLSSYSRPIAHAYWQFSLAMCRWTNSNPSLLLHPLDFIGVDDEPELAFFPSMNIATERKLEELEYLLDKLAESFDPVPMGEHVKLLKTDSRLKCYAPSFG